MSFKLKRKEAVPDGVRRVACERIERALDALDGRAPASDEAVHEARKRMREVRGSLRLVRGDLGRKWFDRENAVFRDAGRPLSNVRDAKVFMETVDKLVQQYRDELAPGAFKHLKLALQGYRRTVRKNVLGDHKVTRGLVNEMQKAQRRVAKWPLTHRGWKAVAGGLGKTYQQGRLAMQEALHAESDETFHEWRKRAKDLRYSLELLAGAWPQAIESLAESAHNLTNLLGEDHDLAVLQGMVKDQLKNVPDEEQELLISLATRRREELQKEASELGRKLYAENADEFVSRMHQYWQQWG